MNILPDIVCHCGHGTYLTVVEVMTQYMPYKYITLWHCTSAMLEVMVVYTLHQTQTYIYLTI